MLWEPKSSGSNPTEEASVFRSSDDATVVSSSVEKVERENDIVMVSSCHGRSRWDSNLEGIALVSSALLFFSGVVRFYFEISPLTIGVQLSPTRRNHTRLRSRFVKRLQCFTNSGSRERLFGPLDS